jgi:16S rRNA (guanine966-N2)-methyltransferase
VRITGGEWRSRRLAGPPRGADARPTPDALREQAFAVLGPHLDGAFFLDLFAGTGIVSCEALSRGAARAWLVERDRRMGALILANLTALEVAGRGELVALPAEAAIRRLAGRGVACSVAWCDAPFAAWHEGVAVLALAVRLGVLAAGALCVVELPPRATLELPGLEIARHLRGAVLTRVATQPRRAS